MASLGRLTIDMVANLGGFESDLKRASRTTQREMNKVNRSLRFAQRDADQAAARIRNLGLQMAAVAGIGLGLVVREFRNMSQEADRIQKLAIATGLTAEAVQELGFAAEQSGSDLEGMVKGIQQLQKNIVQARDGLATYTRAFERVGVSVKDLDGLNAEEQFLVLAQAISEVEDPTERTATAMELLGRAGKDLIPLLNRGSDGVRQLQEQMRATGGVMSQEMVDNFAKFNDAMNVLRNQLKAIKVQFGADLIEPLANVAEFLAHTERGAEVFEQVLRALKHTVIALAGIITTRFVVSLTVAIGQFVIAQREVARLTAAKAALGSTTAATAVRMRALGTAVSVALGPIGIAIAVIGTLILSTRGLTGEMRDAASGAVDLDRRFKELTATGREFARLPFEAGLNQLQAEMIETSQRVEELQVALRAAENMASGSFNKAGMRLHEVNQVQEQARKNVERLTEELEDLEAQQEKNTQRQREWTEAMDEAERKYKEQEERINSTVEASANFNQSLNRLAASMSGEVAQAQLAYNEKIAEAEELHAKGEISAAQLARAYELYGQELNVAISVSDDFVRSLEDMEASMKGPVASATLAFSRNIEEAGQKLSEGRITLMEYLRSLQVYAAQLEAIKQQARDESGFTFGIDFDFIKKSLDDAQKQMQEIAAIEWGFENLIDSFHPLAREMRMLGDAIELVNDRVENGKMGEMPAMFMKTGMAASAAFGAIMEGMDRSSKEYKQMAIAQEVVNTALGIAAILQQGQGDPYSAFARMAAMAAMVASLGVNVANMSGGGGGNVARNRQDAQGTGTVLGDMEAKSESIANAIETTADATSSLVGINRGMLNALHAIQQGISGAAGMVARGALDIDMSGLSLGRSDWGLTNTKLVDQGIALMGGAIADMTSGAVAQAFAESRRSNLFSTRYRTVFEDLDDAFNDQVNLIFRSMIDTVEAAGVALGIPLEEIQARIARFEVEAQQISLMDLTAEEQRAELEAVFSAIFDDLAASVVPFIGQFQKIGEGMGEALVRVATGVQVMQEAISRLGFALDAVGPEAFAQASEGLIELAGGLDQFIESMGTFFDKFAPESRKFEVLQSDLTRALEQAGLAVPDTRDAMWDLMQSLDATTEEGREQIATLLRLAEVSDAYYSMLEEQERERLQREMRLAETMRDIHDQTLELISPAHAEYNQLAQEMAAQIRLLQELGASERQVADLRRMHTLQMQAFAAALRESIQSLTDQLFNTQSLEQASQSVGRSMDNIRDQIIRGIEGVQNWLDRQLLGPTSSLLPVERLEVSGQQFFDAISAVQGGDLSQFGDLPGMADAFLRQASTFHGTSTAAYREIELMVRSAMESITDIDVPDEREQIQSIVQATQDTALSAAEQVMLGADLLQRIAVLSRITGDSPSDIARELDPSIAQILGIMGDVPDLTGDALSAYFDDVVLAINDELSVLMDLNSIQGSALDTLLRIESILSREWSVPIPSDMGIADMHTGGPVIGDGVRNLQDGEYVVPRAGALVADTGGWDRLEQRMASVERLLERQNELTDEEIGAIRQGSAATVTHLKEQSSAARSRQARPAAPRELSTP